MGSPIRNPRSVVPVTVMSIDSTTHTYDARSPHVSARAVPERDRTMSQMTHTAPRIASSGAAKKGVGSSVPSSGR